MSRTRIKICGITRPEDAAEAARLGADAIGLVFYPPSPRFVGKERAREIALALPPFVAAVGLFLDADPASIETVLETVPLDLLQFHGRETAAQCAAFGRRYIKAIPMGDVLDPRGYVEQFEDARGFLMDSNVAGVAGGTGKSFDWARIPSDLGRPLILAGGLDPGNVAEAVARVSPYGVDVSSGVESTKGVKDMALIEAFIRGVSRGESC